MYWSWYFFYQGMCQLLGYSLFGELGNVIVATTAQYLFYVCMNMNLLFAFNRFSAVVYRHSHDRLFSNFNGLIYVALIYIGSAIMNIPGFMFLSKYYPELGTFNYFHMPSVAFLKISICLEMIAVYGVHIAIFILYGWAYMTYRKMKLLTVHHKKERRLLIQAIISGSPCFVLMTCHHLIHFPLLEVLAGELCVGIDPIIYMWFNHDIRNDFFDIIGIKKLMKRFNSASVYTTEVEIKAASSKH
uniref:7TM GPCR serpentine receptor class x (Srx) domain-containing protein n=1 Tax=Panagrolaimus davidi TaxID=227884 RepID=A0A914QGL6_9BILA